MNWHHMQVFIHRVRKYVGSHLVQLGGKVDALIFSAGIGENCPSIREAICADLEAFGIEMDTAVNTSAARGQVTDVSAATSKAKVLVMPTDEELCIAQDTAAVAGL